MIFFLYPMLDPIHTTKFKDVIGTGSKSSAGAVSGQAVFTVADSKELHKAGISNILVINDPTPEELDGFAYANGVIAMHGGVTSPAADEARTRTIPAVTALHGCGMTLNVHDLCVERDGAVVISKLDEITVDGSSGRVFRGVVPTVEAGEIYLRLWFLLLCLFITYLLTCDVCSVPVPAGMDSNFLTFMKWVQKFKRMGVFCNAQSLDEATKGIDLGADGLGEYRTENVLMKEGNKDLFLGVLFGANRCDLV
jgi:pyruvate, orthophosphate dikinase